MDAYISLKKFKDIGGGGGKNRQLLKNIPKKVINLGLLTVGSTSECAGAHILVVPVRYFGPLGNQRIVTLYPGTHVIRGNKGSWMWDWLLHPTDNFRQIQSTMSKFNEEKKEK